MVEMLALLTPLSSLTLLSLLLLVALPPGVADRNSLSEWDALLSLLLMRAGGPLALAPPPGVVAVSAGVSGLGPVVR